MPSSISLLSVYSYLIYSIYFSLSVQLSSSLLLAFDPVVVVVVVVVDRDETGTNYKRGPFPPSDLPAPALPVLLVGSFSFLFVFSSISITTILIRDKPKNKTKRTTILLSGYFALSYIAGPGWAGVALDFSVLDLVPARSYDDGIGRCYFRFSPTTFFSPLILILPIHSDAILLTRPSIRVSFYLDFATNQLNAGLLYTHKRRSSQSENNETKR